ncbi:nucleotide exchange factor GrpE [Streptomyces sp. NPDC001985]|uniref:nucleotide exchange factor GrpE n=1 Tax=Streptomyces sp. NPDC001985 TaxID=3154406 RepID=UPI003316DCB0
MPEQGQQSQDRSGGRDRPAEGTPPEPPPTGSPGGSPPDQAPTGPPPGASSDGPPPEPEPGASPSGPPPESPPELWRDDAPQPREAPGRAAPAAGQDPDELTDRWKRALADLDNLRKRYARDRPRELEAERARVAAAWLPVLDHLELALAHADADADADANADADADAIVRGVRAVRDQAVEVLRGLGYPRHDETGVPFDPQRHDVVSVVDTTGTETAPGTVVQVLRPGYGDPGRQLRPAAVTVSREPE